MNEKMLENVTARLKTRQLGFYAFLNKEFNIKAAATYRRQMTKYAKELLSDVLQVLSDFCDVGMAATTDIWSSRCQDSFISLTAHFVDRHFRLHRFYTSI